MGASGRGWFWMGAMGCRDTGGHKNKTRRDINGCAGHDLDPYGRGNFPGHYVLQQKSKKHARSTPDGCACVSMGAGGGMDTEESKNKTKRETNDRAGHVLQCMVKGRKNEELENEGNERQEASCGRIMGQQRVFGVAMDMHSMKKQSNKQRSVKKKQHKATNCCKPKGTNTKK